MYYSKYWSLCLLKLSLVIFSSFTVEAQKFQHWGSLIKGKYEVGYRDTVIINPNEDYSYYKYRDKKPFFINIWYPAIDNPRKRFMKFGEYLIYDSKDQFPELLDSVVNKYRNFLIRGAICKDSKDLKTVDYDRKHKKIFGRILASTVPSKRNLLIVNGKHPAIFYHHGAQSIPMDNNTFCEYMASHGFVVISSNYLWPTENERDMKSKNSIEDISFILSQFMSTKAIDKDRIVAAGHSWGGQQWMLYDTQSLKPFKEIIAWHTTLEPWDVEFAKKNWPNLLFAYENRSQLMTTPAIIFAPVCARGPRYMPFKENKHTPYLFVTVNNFEMNHDAFVSFGNLRAPYATKYKLPDKDVLIHQNACWERIVLFTQSLINKALGEKDVSFDNLHADSAFFRLSTYNIK